MGKVSIFYNGSIGIVNITTS